METVNNKRLKLAVQLIGSYFNTYIFIKSGGRDSSGDEKQKKGGKKSKGQKQGNKTNVNAMISGLNKDFNKFHKLSSSRP
jgi:hypothetical protein